MLLLLFELPTLVLQRRHHPRTDQLAAPPSNIEQDDLVIGATRFERVLGRLGALMNSRGLGLDVRPRMEAELLGYQPHNIAATTSNS